MHNWVLWCAHSLFYSSSLLNYCMIAVVLCENFLCVSLYVYACAFLGYSLRFRWIVFIIFLLKLHIFECLCVGFAVTSSCLGLASVLIHELTARRAHDRLSNALCQWSSFDLQRKFSSTCAGSQHWIHHFLSQNCNVFCYFFSSHSTKLSFRSTEIFH